MVQLCCLFRAKIAFFAVFTLAASITVNPAQARADSRVLEADAFILSLINDIRITVEAATETNDERKAAINAVVDTYFDVDGITRFSAGRYWRAASDEQRVHYAKQFRNVLVNTASRQFDQINGLTFIPTMSKVRGEKLILVGGIIQDSSGALPDVEIFWRVSAIAGQPMRVIDVQIENISMLKTQRDENEAIIRRGGGSFDALLQSLDERLAAMATQ
ncbi:MAG: ABC transporter substrate-binding protein [Alphaproteobacteria bacterium]|nr:ABC transporter substrate-binding protein [Alphaproteobacteria bacterium]